MRRYSVWSGGTVVQCAFDDDAVNVFSPSDAESRPEKRSSAGRPCPDRATRLTNIAAIGEPSGGGSGGRRDDDMTANGATPENGLNQILGEIAVSACCAGVMLLSGRATTVLSRPEPNFFRFSSGARVPEAGTDVENARRRGGGERSRPPPAPRRWV